MGIFDFVTNPSQPINRTSLDNGLIISTVNTGDEGPETAIIDDAGVHPVERYSSAVDAREGHEEWCRKAAEFKNGDSVIKLGGLCGIVKSRKIQLTINDTDAD